MKKLVIGSLIGMAVLSACASHTPRPSGQHGVVKFIPLGGIAANSYGLAYQTCRSTGLTTLTSDVQAGAQPHVAADAYAGADFSIKARPFAIDGCLDALSGRPATPPAKARPARP